VSRHRYAKTAVDPQSREALALLRLEGIEVVPVGLLGSLAAIVESAPYAMALLDEGFRHLGTSGDYCSTLRADRIAILGKTHKELFSSLPKDWELAQKRCMAGESSKFEHDWTPVTIGKRRRMSWQLHPWRKSRTRIGGAILFLQELPSGDGLSHNATNVQCQHASKMESVCHFAASIAHDINNMLVVINGYSSMLSEELAANHQLAQEAQAILRAGERAVLLTDQLLLLSRM
jgi:hypothetical protein